MPLQRHRSNTSGCHRPGRPTSLSWHISPAATFELDAGHSSNIRTGTRERVTAQPVEHYLYLDIISHVFVVLNVTSVSHAFAHSHAHHVLPISQTMCCLVLAYRIDAQERGSTTSSGARSDASFQCRCSGIGITHRDATGPDALLPYMLIPYHPSISAST